MVHDTRFLKNNRPLSPVTFVTYTSLFLGRLGLDYQIFHEVYPVSTVDLLLPFYINKQGTQVSDLQCLNSEGHPDCHLRFLKDRNTCFLIRPEWTTYLMSAMVTTMCSD